jgi:hypothetical protein
MSACVSTSKAIARAVSDHVESFQLTQFVTPGLDPLLSGLNLAHGS